MAAGDIKGEEAITMELLSTGGITKGQLEHCESDGHWEVCTTGDLGPFAVACETALTGVYHRAVVWGRVEVTLEGASDAVPGRAMIPSTTGTLKVADATTTGLVAGLACETTTTTGDLFTLFVGIGGT
jgi:hypothetical protein